MHAELMDVRERLALIDRRLGEMRADELEVSTNAQSPRGTHGAFGEDACFCRTHGAI